MDKEIEILTRLAANHLHLAQFEPLRAVLLALRSRNPELALAVLQTIVARSGRFQNILWSDSCPSPPLLTYMSTLELLQQFDDNSNASSAWSFDPETLRLRAEFLLLVQHLIDRVSESMRNNFDFQSLEKEVLNESEGYDERADVLEREKCEELRDVNGGFDECVRVLDRVLELGIKRLKPDADVDVDVDGDGNDIDMSSVEEIELVCLKRVILDYADVFDALCWNIQRQVRGWEGFDSGLAETARSEEEGEDLRVLGLIQRSVQLAHLDAIKECLKDGNKSYKPW